MILHAMEAGQGRPRPPAARPVRLGTQFRRGAACAGGTVPGDRRWTCAIRRKPACRRDAVRRNGDGRAGDAGRSGRLAGDAAGPFDGREGRRCARRWTAGGGLRARVGPTSRRWRIRRISATTRRRCWRSRPVRHGRRRMPPWPALCLMRRCAVFCCRTWCPGRCRRGASGWRRSQRPCLQSRGGRAGGRALCWPTLFVAGETSHYIRGNTAAPSRALVPGGALRHVASRRALVARGRSGGVHGGG